jgi:predicted alpha/beta hydrolase family esterase
MTMIAAAKDDFFLIINTGNSSPLALRALLGLPARGETHLDYAAATDSQRNLWTARLDQTVLHAEKPVLLVAGGASCFAAAWWAWLSPGDYVSRIAGALLFDPPSSSYRAGRRSGAAATGGSANRRKGTAAASLLGASVHFP